MATRVCPCCNLPLTAEKFVATYRRCVPRDHPGWRLGQGAFNYLHAVWPELAETIRGGPLDPYYDDSRLAAFDTFILNCWEGPTLA